MTNRSIAQIIPAQETIEGEGIRIRRAFPTRTLADLDPFLLLDHMGPLEVTAGEDKGFPDHPHRGFETVTYVLEGEFEHKDSFGNHGRLGPGDVQWMTAGSGLVHSEMPSARLLKEGGRLQGFQLWINLPRRDKMKAPHYQELSGARIPVARDVSGKVEVKVIAGEALGQRGLIETHIPITYLHVILQPGAEFTQAVAQRSNALVYVISGAVGSPAVSEGHFATFLRDGDSVTVSNAGESAASLLFLAGEPIGEPVARWGPFVMNTREEIQQAFADFQSGRMGTIAR